MKETGFGSRLRALWRLFVIFGAIVPFTVTLWLWTVLRLPGRARFKQAVYRCVNRLVGFQIECCGQPSKSAPTLFAANHISYFDIPILMALTDASFVSKSSVRSWPLIGWAAAVQGTVFIDRRRGAARAEKSAMRSRLEDGRSLVFFPEGTSGAGNHVLTFKSSLFAVAEEPVGGKAVAVQPVSIAYTQLDDFPMGRYLRPLFAWYGDMEFGSHIYRALSLGVVKVVVEFHRAVTIDDFGDRKALSRYCQEEVSKGLSAALAGRGRDLSKIGAAAHGAAVLEKVETA